ALTYLGAAAFTGYGNASANVITGGSGNDLLLGGAGGDRFVGGAGVDTVSYADTNTGITLNFKTGEHTGIAAGDTFEGIEVFRGSAAADRFVSDAVAHTFEGGGGLDTLDYSGSDAAITISVDAANRGTGAGGDAQGDVFTGISFVAGSVFNDTFTSYGSTTFQGGAGDDVYYLYGNSVVSELAGGGYDEVRTTLATYRLTNEVEALTYLGTSNFTGYGNASDNVITGGIANDLLFGGAGADRFVGGAGTDTVSYGDAVGSAGVTLNFKTGVHEGIAAGDTFDGIEVFRGSAAADRFVSDAAAHTFEGGGGLDTLDYSGSGAAITINVDAANRGTGVGGDAQGDVFTGMSFVVGSAFNDTFTSYGSTTLLGGAGDDVYYLYGNSVVSELAGGGYDEVRTTLTNHRLGNEIEALTYLGTSSFTGYGNASDNIITGGIANDLLFGGAGADRFVGGAGTDTVSYGDAVGSTGVTLNFKTGVHGGIAAGDTFDSIEVFRGSASADVFVSDATAHVFEGGGGADTLDYSTSDQAITITVDTSGRGTGVGGDAEGDVFTGFTTVIGSSFDDTFTTSAATTGLAGGAGNDVYYLYNNALVTEMAGGGYDEVRTTLNNYRMTNEVEALTYLGTANFIAYDSASDNTITGGVGNDMFYAGAGGADRFIGGGGTDSVSYANSNEGVTLNFKTGVHGGVAAGDTFDSIEKFYGSNREDVFVANDEVNVFDAAAGVDLLTFASEGAGIVLNLNNTGVDTFLNFEIFEGSGFNDTLIGTGANENFIGGAGADTINGGAGKDFAWYVNSSAGVSVNLATGATSGGDAEGDVLTGIEGLAGSAFDDVLNGDAGSNTIFGAEGSDIINGGAGNDFLYGDGIYYGDFGVFARNESKTVTQADIINGGDGDDTIYGGGNDLGAVLHGDAGNDTIQTARGTAYGDDGNDNLAGNGIGYKLYGGAGADQLKMYASGFADGGEGGDTYTVDSWAQVTIQDTGAAGVDKVILKKFEAFSDVVLSRLGDDAFLFTKTSWETGKLDSGVKLTDWYAGSNTIESFQTNNGDTFTIT
ncbi:calcium-binding protein, partial [Pseudomonas sp. CAM1A]|uniref:beta strand repeat-containing protein n=1 Tax=Pseudomonas sp. CAM1A TaxID=3231717 RepID=UPI0039C5DBE6